MFRKGELQNKYYPSQAGGGTPPLTGETKVGLIAAQSNLDGRNNIVDLPIDIINPSLTVKYYSNAIWYPFDCTIPPPRFTTSDTYAADTIMMNRLADNLGEDVYFVKKSRGGTCFFLNNPTETGSWNIASNEVQDHYRPFVQRIINTRNFCEKVLFTNFKPLYLWIDIVETDAQFNTKTQYKIDQTNFIEAIRTLVGVSDLPIIAREMGSNQTGWSAWVTEAQSELSSEITNYTLISSAGLTMFDGIHLDPSSTNEYANRVLSVVEPLYT